MDIPFDKTSLSEWSDKILRVNKELKTIIELLVNFKTIYYHQYMEGAYSWKPTSQYFLKYQNELLEKHPGCGLYTYPGN